MGIPIKERGIRWTEKYSEKSSDLKQEMRKQIGEGSYFRWEGHDYTTGNDYYVVISPGYSIKKGYFFFAGLRKMPANHGASGKKFSTQEEALNYAITRWKIPRPLEKPAKRYTRDDLVNVPIVIGEKGSKTSFSSIDSNNKINNELKTNTIIIKKSMALPSIMEQKGIGSNWKRLSTQKHMAQQLCGALRSSGTIGFLAGMYNQISVIGIDGTNHSGSESKHKYSPLVATSMNIPENNFSEFMKPVWTYKKLFETTSSPDQKYKFLPTRKEKQDDKYKHLTWNDYKIYLRINVPYRLYAMTSSLWDNLEKLNSPKETSKQYQNIKSWDNGNSISILLPGNKKPNQFIIEQNQTRSKGEKSVSLDSTLRIEIGIVPNLYLEAKKLIASFEFSPSIKTRLTFAIPDKTQNSMSKVIEDLSKRNQIFDTNQVIYEKTQISNSQMLVYDDHGMPFAFIREDKPGMSLVPKSTEDKSGDTHSYIGQLKNSLNGSKRLIADHIRYGMGSSHGFIPVKYNLIMQKQEELNELKQKPIENKEKISLIVSEIKTMSSSLISVANTLNKSSIGRKEETEKFLKLCDNYIDAKLALTKKSYELSREGLELSSNTDDGLYEKMIKSYDLVKPYFQSFRVMAALGIINLDSKRFVHSKTIAPVTAPVFTKAYDINENGLPKNTNELLTRMRPREIVPETKISAYKDNNKFYARKAMVQGDKVYHSFEEIDKDNAEQQANGAPLWVIKANRSIIFDAEDENSPVYNISAGPQGVQRMDPNSNGRFIPGGTFSVLARPVGETPMKTQKGMDFAGGWSIEQEEYTSSEIEGIPGRSIKRQPEPLLPMKLNPEKNKKFYDLTKEDGTVENVAPFISENDMTWSDSGKMLHFLKYKLGISDDVMGAFTKMDRNDLFVTKDKEETAKHVYSIINAAKKMDSSPEIKAESLEIQKQSEWKELYDFGELCNLCGKVETGGMGDRIDPKIVDILNEAMNNPRQSFSPKTGNLYGIKVNIKQGEKIERQWLKNNNKDDYPLLFSSKLSPWLKQYMQQISVTMAGSDPQIETFEENDSLIQSIRNTGNLVENRENIEKSIYNDKGKEQPKDPWPEDKKIYKKEYKEEENKVQEEEKEEEKITEEETVVGEDTPKKIEEEEPIKDKMPKEEKNPVSVKSVPTIQTEKETIADPVSNTLNTLLFDPIIKTITQNNIDINNLSTSNQNKIIELQKAINSRIDKIRSLLPHAVPKMNQMLNETNFIKLIQYVPQLHEKPIQEQVVTVAKTTKTQFISSKKELIKKLTKLANSLDEQGKSIEANSIDKLIDLISKKN